MRNETLSFDVTRAHEYELRVELGDPLSPHGLTRATVDGTGRFAAEQIFESDEMEDAEAFKEGHPPSAVGRQLKQDAAQEILRLASQFRWDREFPSRPGIPDEAIVVWTYGVKGGDHVSTKVWLREAEADPVMGPVLAALRNHLDEIPECKIYL